MAQVDGTPITLADFTARLRETPPAYQQYVTTPEGRRQFLNLLIREKVLLVESRRAGLQHQDEYRKAIRQFEQRWKRQRKDYADSLLIEMYIARLRSKELAVSDTDVRSYYDAHLADFTHPIQIQASHILVKTEPEAEQVLARLKSGASFESLAKSVSLDPATAAQGGKLAPFTRGSLVPEFEDAAFRLKIGELSGVVKSSFGYHIIKKTGQKNLPGRSFEEAKDAIRDRLQREKFDAWVNQTQASLGVRIDEKALAGLTTQPTL